MSVGFQSWRSARTKLSTLPVPSSSLLPPGHLVTDRRLDLAVKWRFFKALQTGSDEDSERVYRWHIKKRSGARMANGMATDKWKVSVDDYVSAASTLCLSMTTVGFDPAHPVPVDPNGELLGGAHRVACALALGLEEIPVAWEPRYCFAPAWDGIWFEQEGMKLMDLDRLYADWEAMRR